MKEKTFEELIEEKTGKSVWGKLSAISAQNYHWLVTLKHPLIFIKDYNYE